MTATLCGRLQLNPRNPMARAPFTAAPRSKEDFSALAEGYRFVHHLENRLRIVADRAVDVIASSDEEWDALARRARLSLSGKPLRAEYERISTAVRAAFERVLNV